MTTSNVLPEKFYTVPQVAERLGVSARSVWRWIDRKDLTAHRLGRSVRISETSLQAYLDRSRQA
jgi:excisionase family DNA binding protein